MATDAKADMTQAELLRYYLDLRLQRGDREIPLAQMLADFPEYLRQRGIMRGMIREADDAVVSGRSGPLEIEAAIDEVVRDLAKEGIVE
jgi:hypothetical protein